MSGRPPKGKTNPALAQASQPRDALFGTSKDFPHLVELDLGKIDRNPDQPRKHFDDEALRGLADSIEMHGLKQPILVKGPSADDRYLIVAGERRFRAHELLGRSTIFAIITQGDTDEISLIENVQRKDLTLFELSDSFHRMTQRSGYTHEKLAKLASRSRTEVTQILGLNRLSPRIREEAERIEVAKGILFELVSVDGHQAQEDFWEKIKAGMKLTLLREEKAKATRPRASLPSFSRLAKTSQRFALEIEAAKSEVDQGAALDEQQRTQLQRLRDMIDQLLG